MNKLTERAAVASKPHRLAVGLGPAALAIVFLLAGCTASEGAQPTDQTPSPSTSAGQPATDEVATADYADFAVEYTEALTEFQALAPPGVSLPKDIGEGWDEAGQFEDGLGDITAAFHLQCAWLGEYTDAVEAADKERVDLSLDALEAWAALPAVQAHVEADSLATWLTDALTPARTGDDDALRRFGSGCADANE